jgi:predicted transcriptional regulator
LTYFKIDNDIFSLRLDSYEFQVYAYLVSCAGKKGECWPSTNTIAKALGMSQSTVIGKIDSLVRRQLIDKRTTTRRSDRGRISTANNHYFIRSAAEAKMAHERFPGGHGGQGGTLTDEEDIREQNECLAI